MSEGGKERRESLCEREGEGGRKGEREGGKKGGRVRGREEGKEGRREGGREGGRIVEGVCSKCHIFNS